MTPINRAGVWKAIRRRRQHDKAMMPGKYSLFIHLNILQLAEVIMMNNRCHSWRLRGQITCDDIKKQFCVAHLRRENIIWHGLSKYNWFHFLLRIPLNQEGLTRSAFHSLFMYLCIYLFTLPRELWWMCGCRVCRIPISNKAKPLHMSLEPRS